MPRLWPPGTDGWLPSKPSDLMVGSGHDFHSGMEPGLC